MEARHTSWTVRVIEIVIVKTARQNETADFVMVVRERGERAVLRSCSCRACVPVDAMVVVVVAGLADEQQANLARD